jgi:hypothetical protein
MTEESISKNHENCAPRPESMISSLRAFGYDLSMAIADLIDNSIYAQAKNIVVDYEWNEGDPWIRILDDGKGMTENQLREAMRLGSQSPLDVRDDVDLGRFGLGLKTASFSQSKLLTVYTKTGPRQVATRSWDLDHVCTSGKWELCTKAPTKSVPLLSILDNLEHGSVVLCQKIDRLAQRTGDGDEEAQANFFEAFGKVARYLEIVFHRYLSGRDRVAISVGRHICQPWDPFLLSNGFTQVLSLEHLDQHRIEVKPFVLPHVSKRTVEETGQGAGLYGWNAHQGFYIYRNKRMIIPGGYLDLPFTAEEHYKLCRIQVDLPNNLDHEWNIDVRKAAASPPSNVRNDLERIARATRTHAAEVYRARIGGIRQSARRISKHDVWLKKRRGDKILYQINRSNDAIARILSELNPPATWVRKLFHLIEKTVPHRLIIMDNAEFEDCQVNLPPEFEPPPKELIELCCHIFSERVKGGQDPKTAADYTCSFFDEHPAYRAALDQLIEEMT